MRQCHQDTTSTGFKGNDNIECLTCTFKLAHDVSKTTRLPGGHAYRATRQDDLVSRRTHRATKVSSGIIVAPSHVRALSIPNLKDKIWDRKLGYKATSMGLTIHLYQKF